MYWLSLPPTHDSFPSAAVLHAICGLGIMYARQSDLAPTSPSTILNRKLTVAFPTYNTYYSPESGGS